MPSLAVKVGLTGVISLILFLCLCALFSETFGENSKAFMVAVTGMIISAIVIVADFIFCVLFLIWTA